MKAISLFAATVAALTLAACEKGTDAAARPSPTEARPQPATAIVKGETASVEERVFPRYLRVTGQLRGENDAVVAADSTGKVVSVPVERGSPVKVGDVLAKLDERQPRLSLAEAAASLAMAESRLALARNEQERNRPLAERKVVAESDYQKFLTEVAAREAELAGSVARHELAQKMLDDCVIRAPFDGVVAERMVEPGEYVTPDSPVARVVNVARLRLVLNVPETEVGALVIGQDVEFTTAAFPERNFTGEVRFLGAAMREASRDLVIEALVGNGDGTLRPGFFCDARILLREEHAVAVPAGAVRVEGSRRRAFVVTGDGVISERIVEVGETRGGFTEIRRGVASGEAVVVDPGEGAADGVRFEPAA